MRQACEGFPAVRVIAAGYADARRCGTLDPHWLPGIAREAEIAGCLLDTYVKDGHNLFDFLDPATLGALAAEAAQGMRIIDREMQLLTPPDEAELGQAYSRLKELNGEVFGWLPPDVGGLERLGATRMRQYVRTWINEWDLVRLDPSYRPETEMAEVSSDYREDPDLETSGDIAGSD